MHPALEVNAKGSNHSLFQVIDFSNGYFTLMTDTGDTREDLKLNLEVLGRSSDKLKSEQDVHDYIDKAQGECIVSVNLASIGTGCILMVVPCGIFEFWL